MSFLSDNYKMRMGFEDGNRLIQMGITLKAEWSVTKIGLLVSSWFQDLIEPSACHAVPS